MAEITKAHFVHCEDLVDRDEGKDALTVILETLQTNASLRGINYVSYTSRSRRLFEALPADTQRALVTAMKIQNDLLEASSEKSSWIQGELAMLLQAAALGRMSIPDDFLDKVEDGDVVEIYDIEKRMQVYRNLEFLKKSSYDLLTLLVTPYTELFHREPHIVQRIIERSEEVLRTATCAVPWEVESHVLTERLHSHNRCFRMQMKYVCPVFDMDSGRRVAIATTLRCDLLGSAQDSSVVVRL